MNNRKMGEGIAVGTAPPGPLMLPSLDNAPCLPTISWQLLHQQGAGGDLLWTFSQW